MKDKQVRIDGKTYQALRKKAFRDNETIKETIKRIIAREFRKEKKQVSYDEDIQTINVPCKI